MPHLNHVFIAALCVACTLGMARADVLDADGAPPPSREEQAPAPRDGYVWAVGFWAFNGHAYDWVPGHFIFQRRGAHWVPDHWEQAGARWHRTAGHWER